jgi:hypothetical protein
MNTNRHEWIRETRERRENRILIPRPLVCLAGNPSVGAPDSCALMSIRGWPIGRLTDSPQTPPQKGSV